MSLLKCVVWTGTHLFPPAQSVAEPAVEGLWGQAGNTVVVAGHLRVEQPTATRGGTALQHIHTGNLHVEQPTATRDGTALQHTHTLAIKRVILVREIP